MKYFLIARVSREEQIEALPAQKKRLFDYVKNKGVTNYTYFEFNESAFTTKSRKEFGKILSTVQKETKRNKAVVVFDKIDRFTRDSSQEEVKQFKEMLRDNKIELHFPHDNLFLDSKSPAADLFRLGIGMELAAYYAHTIGDNVKRKFEQMISDGYYPRQAPYGYLNVNKGTEKEPNRDIIINEEQAHYVREIYRLRLQGMSYDHICSTMYEAGMRSNKGNKMVKSVIVSILSNKFYIGIMKFGGKELPHRYPHIIPEDVFYACQTINDNRKKIRPKTQTKTAYTFGNRIVTCKRCGRTISSYTKKGHNYLRCASNSACHNPNCAECIAEETVEKALKSVKLDKELTDDIISALKERYANNEMFKKQSRRAIQKEYDRLTEQLATMYQDRLDGRITTTFYDKFATETTIRRDELERQIAKLDNDDEDLEINTSYLLDLVCRMEELYKSSKPALKNKLLRFLFSNLQLDDKKLYFQLNDPFKTISTTTKRHDNRATMSSMAGVARLELTTRGFGDRCSTN